MAPSSSRNCGTFGAFLGRGVCVQHLARPACSRLAKAATGRSNPYQSTASCNAVHTAALLCVADCSMQCFASDSACADASWAENADHIKPDGLSAMPSCHKSARHRCRAPFRVRRKRRLCEANAVGKNPVPTRAMLQSCRGGAKAASFNSPVPCWTL